MEKNRGFLTSEVAVKAIVVQGLMGHSPIECSFQVEISTVEVGIGIVPA